MLAGFWVNEGVSDLAKKHRLNAVSSFLFAAAFVLMAVVYA